MILGAKDTLLHGVRALHFFYGRIVERNSAGLNTGVWAASWLLFVLAVVNLTLYVIFASDPLIVQDAWYFLDTFIRNALSGHLAAHDFFLKRGALDHAQPLRRIILWVELRYFHLDFRVQALAGVLGAAGCALILKRLMVRSVGTPSSEGVSLLLWIIGALTLLNLNSTYVWTWPLVASAFTSYVLFFIAIYFIWRASTEPLATYRVGAAFSLLAFDVAADDTALIANIAIAIALLWLLVKRRSYSRHVVFSLFLVATTFLLARTIYQIQDTASIDDQLSLWARLQALGPPSDHGGWWQWIYIPLTSGVIIKEHLKTVFGTYAVVSQAIIGAILVLAQICFWYRAVKGSVDKASFSAVIFMLVFYGLVAGIIIGRVSYFGNAYLNAPRYALIYSFGWLALILMFSSHLAEVPRATTSKVAGVLLLLVFVLGLQVSYAFAAWHKAPYLRKYYTKIATQIVQIAQNPDVTPASCAPELPLCQYPSKQREDLTGLLARNRLNIFSLTFQRWNNIHVDGAE